MVDTMTYTKKKSRPTCNTGMRVDPFNRRNARAFFIAFTSDGGRRKKHEMLHWRKGKKRNVNSFVKSLHSIWLSRLKQWRRQRVPAGPPVSQHARRARPFIRRSQHGSSSRFILQRHRFLSADSPPQRKGNNKQTKKSLIYFYVFGCIGSLMRFH